MTGLGDFTIFVLIFLILAILLVFMGVKSVPQGQHWTVERFGKYTKSLDPGLHLIVPAIEVISRKMSMMEEVMDIPAQDVITKDNALVRVDGVVFYQIINAAQAAYQVSNLTNAILNLTMTNIRSVLGSMILDEALSKRDIINAQLLKVVDDATNPWGIKVLRVEIKDIAPPQDLVDAMARQMKAERDKRAVILEAEGHRQAEILEAEGEKQAIILEAEGRKIAAFRDAEARERFAQAEAKATEVISEAIREGEMQAVNYLIAIKYMAAVNNIAISDNTKLMLMPLETSGVIGALAGIKELIKAGTFPTT
ncbi:MAG: SPFH/Band 7/PHB domain protein [Gammaproteobacteria bacterium]|nr:MAG: SPFH/Band 7/PHB domain protein [Gammaproteobacteria bacterium]RKZ41364.1 MAG: SPFH/Band 7/PHB domain protein [Gammaproteobacteria bacterium]RKZ71589.1 MAG: SPFH/Band 7/PHB domain protein [Gammaproteobacteria bacterium]